MWTSDRSKNSLKHYEYSIKVEERLKRNVGEHKNWIQVEIDARFERWVP
jgi:hypothetical protein